MEDKQIIRDDEISLIEIIQILWQRKTLIVVVILLCTLVAAGVALVLPKVYEVSIVIEPGSYPSDDDDNWALSPETIMELISSGAYDSKVQQNLGVSAQDYPRLNVSVPKRTALVKISVESSEPEKAVTILSELAQQVIGQNKGVLDVEAKKVQDLIAAQETIERNVNDGILLIEKQIVDISKTLKFFEKEKYQVMQGQPSDTMSLMLYSNEIQNQRANLINLQGQLIDLRLKSTNNEAEMESLWLKLDMIKNTEVLKPPTIPKEPLKLKKRLIVALGFVLGLMASVFLALMLSHAKTIKGL